MSDLSQSGVPLGDSEAPVPDPAPRCRHCDETLRDTVVDLGMHPLCESYLTADQLNRMEPHYPLVVYVCRSCWLVQLEQFVSPESIFGEYAYFSSFAETWVEHARRYVEMIVDRLGLGPDSSVLEVASNDGYLLQHFSSFDVPVLGIEPAANVALSAQGKGVPTRVEFFGLDSAERLRGEGYGADLVIGNNVLAQVPDVNDFVRGLRRILKPGGTVTLEFPHLLHLIEQNQFDTIYHEHFSYFSFTSARNILQAFDLTVYDVEEIPTHGGSLRVYATDVAEDGRAVSSRVRDLLDRERRAGYTTTGPYDEFHERVKETKRALLDSLIGLKRQGKRIAGYGAPGKGNTLLNYCGIGRDFLDFTVDRNPYKQGKFLPGTHIPIFEPGRIDEERPDYVLILPWNFEDEIRSQMAGIREWKGRFIIPIPEVRIEE